MDMHARVSLTHMSEIGDLRLSAGERNRKNDPETIRRNVEILDLYHQGKTRKELVGIRGASYQYVCAVINAEQLWRAKAEHIDKVSTD
jgi:hypothetical protein